ncbi:coiled-coil domain-containing protein 96 [Oryzias melastigma]|nr:coiled-coil domain-containing protein 96 [Oryzias melastigma]
MDEKKNIVKEDKELMSRKVTEEEGGGHSDVVKASDDSSRTENRESRFSPAAGKEEAGPEQLLQELEKEKQDLSQRSRQLQGKLAGHCTAGRANIQLRRTVDLDEDQYEYEVCVRTLTDLKQQIRAYTESAQAQAEELHSQLQEKLEKVETEQQELDALRRSAVAVLSPHLGAEAAQDRVEAGLRADKLGQDSLTKVRLEHFKLVLRICRLEAELTEEEEVDMEVQKQLKAERRRQKELSERQVEELICLIKKHERVSKVLPKLKEKLRQTQLEVQNKRQQVVEVEAAVAEKKDLLIRTKQARDSLQRDNLRREESRGILGNRVLLQDFEDTLEAVEQLEKQLETLKLQRAEIISCCDNMRNLIE